MGVSNSEGETGGFARGWGAGYWRERYGFSRSIEERRREIDSWLVMPFFALLLLFFPLLSVRLGSL